MNILAIDPGPGRSGWAEFLPEGSVVFGVLDNADLEKTIFTIPSFHDVKIVIEQPKCYGAPVGDSILMTCFWIGRFWGACDDRHFIGIPRATVKRAMTGKTTAKASQMRQAVLECFPATGGGKCPQVGTKAKPGPLFGLKGDHIIDALALGLTALGKAPFSDEPIDWGKVWR